MKHVHREKGWKGSCFLAWWSLYVCFSLQRNSSLRETQVDVVWNVPNWTSRLWLIPPDPFPSREARWLGTWCLILRRWKRFLSYCCTVIDPRELHKMALEIVSMWKNCRICEIFIFFFLQSMISQFNIGPEDTHIAVILFSDDARLIFDLTETNQDLNQVGQTLIHKAIVTFSPLVTWQKDWKNFFLCVCVLADQTANRSADEHYRRDEHVWGTQHCGSQSLQQTWRQARCTVTDFPVLLLAENKTKSNQGSNLCFHCGVNFWAKLILTGLCRWPKVGTNFCCLCWQARNVIFFITDGYNTGPASDREVIEEANRIKEIYGAQMYVIGTWSRWIQTRQQTTGPLGSAQSWFTWKPWARIHCGFPVE